MYTLRIDRERKRQNDIFGAKINLACQVCTLIKVLFLALPACDTLCSDKLRIQFWLSICCCRPVAKASNR